jgi:hypothetical protein
MDVSELRRRILGALDAARRDATARRAVADEAARAYAAFVDRVAVPLLKQAGEVLRAERHAFSVQTPAEGPRLVSDVAPHTFLEFQLDVTPAVPQVIGRLSVTRGRLGVVVTERPIGAGQQVGDLTDQDVAAFLVTELPRLVVKP